METGSCHQSRNHSFRTAPFRRVCLVRRVYRQYGLQTIKSFWQSELKSEEADSNSKPDTTTKVMERIASTPLPIPTNTTRLAASSSPPEEKHMAKSSSPPRYTGPDISTGTSCSVAIPPIGIPGIITMRRKYSEPTSTPRHSGN